MGQHTSRTFKSKRGDLVATSVPFLKKVDNMAYKQFQETYRAATSVSFPEVKNMKKKSRSRIRCSAIAVVATFGCLATVLQPPAAFAQTSYYWNGGSGSWDTTSNLWSPTSSGGGSLSWVNGTGSIAYIGYVGTGSTPGAPTVINLTTPIVAQSLVFGTPAGDTPPNHNYNLTGSTITIGDGVNPGLVTIDGGSTQSTGYSFISNNLTVAGGKGLELGVTYTGTASFVNSYHYFEGANTFSSLTIDSALPPGGTGRNWGYFVGSPSFNNGASANVTMGNGAGIADIGASTDVMAIGTVSMSATGYTPLGYAVRGNNLIEIGSGATGTTGGGVTNGTPTVVINGPIQGSGGGAGQSDVLFSSGFTSGGQGTVILNAQSNYVGVTGMNQNSARTVGANMPLLQLGVNNALPTTTDLSFGEANGNSGALDLHGFNQTVNSISTWYKGTSNYHGGITNFTGTVSTLTLNDPSGISATNNAQFQAVIGKLITGTTAQINSSTDNIALNLASTNNGAITLGLAQIEPGVAWWRRQRRTPIPAGRSSMAGRTTPPTALLIQRPARGIRPPASDLSRSTTAARLAAVRSAALWACPAPARSPSTTAALSCRLAAAGWALPLPRSTSSAI